MDNTLVAAEQGRRTVTFLVDPELRRKLEAAAREDDRPLGYIVRAALREHLGAREER